MYNNLNINVPLKKRKAINDKLYQIAVSGKEYNISKEEIYNCFTEKGGNHNLCFSEYQNFSEYSRAKREIEEGQFFTPDSIIKRLYDLVQPSYTDLIADLTAGKGSFINFAPNEKNFYANELDTKSYYVMKYLFPDAICSNNDIFYYEPMILFDVIFGNPPFNLEINGVKSQFYYLRKSSELLLSGGYLIVIMPKSFLDDVFFNKTAIEEIDNSFNFISQFMLEDKSFNANIKTKCMIFQKRSDFIEHRAYNNIYHSYEEAKDLLLQSKQETEKSKHKIYLENHRHSDNEYCFSNPSTNKGSGYSFKLKKYLYEIKTQRRDKLNDVLAYIEKFKTQKKQEGIDDKTWDKMKITENKVISYIKKFLNFGNGKKRKEQIISNKKTNRKKKYFNKNCKSYSDMNEDLDIKNFLQNHKLFSNKIRDYIKLTNIQEKDCNKMLQKNIGYLQYSQGAGKTICGLFQLAYRLHTKQVKKVFIVSHALCISHWDKVLKEEFAISYKTIKKKDDIDNNSRINLISFYYLNKYKRFIDAKDSFLILDEADNISSLNSKVYKSCLSVFRKVKYKLLLSGTMTRNNINEAFPQFELMYNNNDLFKFDVDYIYTDNKGEIKAEKNELVNTNFKPYKKGYSQFASAYNPSKTTVFGIKKQNQDVYNYNSLKKLLDMSVITRSFEEVVGKNLYKISQITVDMNSDEKNLYSMILNDFYKLEMFYFNSIGSERKSAMLRIIRQLNLLLKACSMPQHFNEFNGDATKVDRVIQEAKKYDKLVIGCIRKDSVFEYAKLLKEGTNKKIYCITGATHSINQRKELIKQLENEDNYIIVTTQQALQSSLNINFIDNVFIVEMQYNLSKMSQFFFRFIRFDSKNFKNIHFFTYAYSIESNLLQLVLHKEKLNRIMKQESEDEAKLYEDLGIDFNLFDMLHYKEKNKDGKTITIWEQQSIN